MIASVSMNGPGAGDKFGDDPGGACLQKMKGNTARVRFQFFGCLTDAQVVASQTGETGCL